MVRSVNWRAQRGGTASSACFCQTCYWHKGLWGPEADRITRSQEGLGIGSKKTQVSVSILTLTALISEAVIYFHSENMDNTMTQSCRTEWKKKVKMFWNYILPQRCKDVILVLPINVTQNGDEAKVGAYLSYFISLQSPGSRAWHFQVFRPYKSAPNRQQLRLFQTQGGPLEVTSLYQQSGAETTFLSISYSSHI